MPLTVEWIDRMLTSKVDRVIVDERVALSLGETGEREHTLQRNRYKRGTISCKEIRTIWLLM